MMFDTKQLFKFDLFVGGTVLGTAGITILKSGDTKRVYTHATAAMLRGKDCVVKTVSTLRENCDDIYGDVEDLNERRYAMDAGRVYQKAEAPVEEHEAVTEV